MTILNPCPSCGSAALLMKSAASTPFVSCMDRLKCGMWGPQNDDGAKWNAMLRPADIVAARIEGLREGAKIAQAEFFMQKHDLGYLSSETPCWDDVVRSIDARIAELEATAPEVSDMRAKAEAFDTGAGT